MMDDRNTTQISKTRELLQKEQTYDEPIINKSDLRLNTNSVICEAAGCFSKAAIKLPVRVGTAGTITLFLCEECKSKFRTQSSDEDVVPLVIDTSGIEKEVYPVIGDQLE